MFHKNKSIPNIIFHGPTGSGKRSILNNFINTIYNNDCNLKKTHVMYVDCGHGRGIKFIREELKFFAKTNIHNSSEIIKSIILLNADKLTIDAQSALRRCIELFSTSTRFFIIIEDKYKLLRPILSRFCDIYIARPEIGDTEVNLHKYKIDRVFDTTDYTKERTGYLNNQLKALSSKTSLVNIVLIADKLYNKGYSGLDLLNYIERSKTTAGLEKYKLLAAITKIKGEFRNEKLTMCWILSLSFFRSNLDLENISFI